MFIDYSRGIAVLFLNGNIVENISLIFCLIGFKIQPEIISGTQTDYSQLILVVKPDPVLELEISVVREERKAEGIEQKL